MNVMIMAEVGLTSITISFDHTAATLSIQRQGQKLEGNFEFSVSKVHLT